MIPSEHFFVFFITSDETDKEYRIFEKR